MIDTCYSEYYSIHRKKTPQVPENVDTSTHVHLIKKIKKDIKSMKENRELILITFNQKHHCFNSKLSCSFLAVTHRFINENRSLLK